MSKAEDDMKGVPTLPEIESYLMNTKPRPTDRLRQLLEKAPWHSDEGESSVIRLRRLELLGTGLAVLLVAVVALALISQRRPDDGTTPGAGLGAGSAELTETRDDGRATLQAGAEAVPATDTPTAPEGSVAWTMTLAGMAGEGGQPGGGIAFDAENGRLFVAGGREGIYQFSAAGEQAGTMAVVDPETGEAVSVYDVAWSRFLWLGPPEAGLVALTEPLAGGEYLHLVDPESGAVLRSFTHNGNLALPSSGPPVGERLPTQLAASGEGELFVNRVFTLSSGTVTDSTADFHYLLRMALDGRILNSLAAGEEAAGEGSGLGGAEMIAALAYQGVDGLLYAAVRHEGQGIVGKYDLNGTPRLAAALDVEVVKWQEDVALGVDGQGHLFAAVDGPAYIVEVDGNEGLVQRYGFRERAEAGYETTVTHWLPGDMGRPLALAVTPDGRLLFLVDEFEGEIRLTAYSLAGGGGIR